jgi:hypothetical protein
MTDPRVDLPDSEEAKTLSSCNIGDSARRTTTELENTSTILMDTVEESRFNLATTCNSLTLRTKLH